MRHVRNAYAAPPKSHFTNEMDLEELRRLESYDDDMLDNTIYNMGSRRSRASKRKQADMLELSMFPNDFMEDFDPDHMFKFDVAPKGEESFYIHIENNGTEVKGMF